MDLNLDRAWKELESAKYEWEDSPQAFTNRLICRYAILETQFPKEHLPNRNKLIKRKLWHGLPSTLKGRIESFLDDNYPLTQFLDRLEHERQFLLEAHRTPVCHVPAKGEPNSPSTEKPPLTNEHFEKLQRQLESLSQRMKRMGKPVARYRCHPCRTNDDSRSNCPRPYSAYCRSNSHAFIDCTRRPPVGTCFDCGRQNCRRGQPDCPGRQGSSA